MTKNINDEPFDDATKLKLEIFKECFREWLPVFIHNPAIEKIYIYDFFAGSGTDSIGNSGSPLILLNEAKGERCNVCNSIGSKPIIFGFNELISEKNLILNETIKNYISNCLNENCHHNECHYKYQIGDFEFKDAFNRDNFKKILHNKKYAKFILLDQYGFSQVDESIFRELVDAPKTDFIFFIASAFIKRFKEHANTKKYIDTSKIDYENCKPKERHKLIANYFQKLIPGKEYYLHHFTIKKRSNHYGLIFGSNHSLGMEKFLKVCWKKDVFAGESNDNSHNDFQEGELYFNPVTSNKKEAIKAKIQEKVLNGEISDNISGFKYTLDQLCLPKIFTEVIIDLEKRKLIKRSGEINDQSVNIHVCKKYKIERIIK